MRIFTSTQYIYKMNANEWIVLKFPLIWSQFRLSSIFTFPFSSTRKVLYQNTKMEWYTMHTSAAFAFSSDSEHFWTSFLTKNWRIWSKKGHHLEFTVGIHQFDLVHFFQKWWLKGLKLVSPNVLENSNNYATSATHWNWTPRGNYLNNLPLIRRWWILLHNSQFWHCSEHFPFIINCCYHKHNQFRMPFLGKFGILIWIHSNQWKP